MTRIERTKFWAFMPKILRVLIIILASVVTLIVFSETVLRTVEWLSFDGYEELLIIAAFWLYMIGTAHGSYENSQIRADIIEVMVKESIAKDVLRIIRDVVTIGLSFVFLWWSWNLIIYAIGVGSVTSVYRIPMVFGFSSIFVGVAFFTFYHSIYAIGNFKKIYLRRVKKVDLEQWMAEHGVEGGVS